MPSRHAVSTAVAGFATERVVGNSIRFDTFATVYVTYSQCTLINFIATEKGLEDQLLAKVVGVERPELEKQAQELQSAFNQVSRTQQ